MAMADSPPDEDGQRHTEPRMDAGYVLMLLFFYSVVWPVLRVKDGLRWLAARTRRVFGGGDRA